MVCVIPARCFFLDECLNEETSGGIFWKKNRINQLFLFFRQHTSWSLRLGGQLDWQDWRSFCFIYLYQFLEFVLFLNESHQLFSFIVQSSHWENDTCDTLDCFKSPFIFFFLSHSSVVFSKFFASCDTPWVFIWFCLIFIHWSRLLSRRFFSLRFFTAHFICWYITSISHSSFYTSSHLSSYWSFYSVFHKYYLFPNYWPKAIWRVLQHFW